MNNITLHKGNSSKVLKKYPDNHFDSIVTDPPYGIEFLGKDWDKNTGAIEVWQECLRVLKPGGHILAFSAARTYHRLATNLEDVGFEIRDQIMWIYASGFPKGQDIGKLIEKRGNDGEEYKGWKTGLKPAHEPIVMARKPFKGSTVDNVLNNGVGALNIDDTRVPHTEDFSDYLEGKAGGIPSFKKDINWKTDDVNHINDSKKEAINKLQDLGRYPSNVIMSEEDKEYSQYFYCPKVSRKERNIGTGVEGKGSDRSKKNFMDEQQRKVSHCLECGKNISQAYKDCSKCFPENKLTNNHPTVKPVALMKYLVTLVTPKGGKVLDPFNGSGSTGMAVKEFGGEYVGIELNKEYINISKKRIKAW